LLIDRESLSRIAHFAKDSPAVTSYWPHAIPRPALHERDIPTARRQGARTAIKVMRVLAGLPLRHSWSYRRGGCILSVCQTNQTISAGKLTRKTRRPASQSHSRRVAATVRAAEPSMTWPTTKIGLMASRSRRPKIDTTTQPSVVCSAFARHPILCERRFKLLG